MCFNILFPQLTTVHIATSLQGKVHLEIWAAENLPDLECNKLFIVQTNIDVCI